MERPRSLLYQDKQTGEPILACVHLHLLREATRIMVRLAAFDELEDFVRENLCQRADLDLATPLVRMVLKRKGRPCGVEFTLVAPRAVRLSAIWEAASSRVFFYDQNLERFQVSTISGLSIEHLPSQASDVKLQSMWRGK